ncbi:MAG TPA: hypothetical protein VFO85_02355 [Vicinamibacteria bacterium]|nr:hypothetical protein [Vicinamibacteria bacterium]
MEKSQTARCVHCRSDVRVPDSYAHGDHIKCGDCGTKHKVVRGEVLKLVIADATPFREMLDENRRLVERLEDELVGARRSFGLGVNGLGMGVIYFLAQVGLGEETWSVALAWEAVGVAVATGVFLEAANWFFLAKRHRITRINAELDEAREAGRHLEKIIREASRV